MSPIMSCSFLSCYLHWCGISVKRLPCLFQSRWKTFLLGILAGVYIAFSGALSYTIAGEVNDVSPLSHMASMSLLHFELQCQQNGLFTRYSICAYVSPNDAILSDRLHVFDLPPPIRKAKALAWVYETAPL